MQEWARGDDRGPLSPRKNIWEKDESNGLYVSRDHRWSLESLEVCRRSKCVKPISRHLTHRCSDRGGVGSPCPLHDLLHKVFVRRNSSSSSHHSAYQYMLSLVSYRLMDGNYFLAAVYRPLTLEDWKQAPQLFFPKAPSVFRKAR
jgi:hypothetical protein